MTRETKIGLLVGLVFIIVVGVLLSDHLVNATDPKPAAIADVGSHVLDSMRNPGGANVNNISPEKPTNVAPQESVSTHSEIARADAPAHADVVVGPAPTPAPVVIADAQANGNVPTVRRLAVDPTAGSPVVLDNGTSANPVVVSPGPETSIPAPTAVGPGPVVPEAAAVAAAPKSQEYKAQAGDTVAKMARKFYGSDTRANRDLIINANAPLKADPRKIVIGKSYTIPAKPGSEAAPAAAVAGATATSPAATATAAAPAAGAGERIYTVKSGDNIWKIAKEQLKNSNAADQIRKLNRDVLKNGDNLKIGMQLKLPAKAD